MNSFQKIVIYTALGILLVSLILIFMMLYYSSSNQAFPSIVGKCPDFFVIGQDGNCKSVGGLNSSYVEPPFMGGTKAELCQKRNQLINQKLTWDGITNNEDVCDFS